VPAVNNDELTAKYKKTISQLLSQRNSAREQLSLVRFRLAATRVMGRIRRQQIRSALWEEISNASAETQSSKINQMKASWQRRLSAMEGRYKEANAALLESEASAEELAENLEQAQIALTAEKSVTARAKERIQSLLKDVESWRDKHGELEHQAQTERAQSETLEVELRELKLRLAEMTQQCEKETKLRSDCEATIASLDATLVEKEAMLAGRDGNLELFREKLHLGSPGKLSNEQLSMRWKDLELKRLKKEVDQLQLQVAAGTAGASPSSADISEEVLKSIAEKDLEIRVLREELSELKLGREGTAFDLERRYQALLDEKEEDNGNLMTTLRDVKKKLDRAQEERNDLKVQLHEKITRLRHYEEDNRKVHDSNQNLLESTDKELQKWQQRLEEQGKNHREHSQSLTENLRKKAEEIESLRGTIGELKAELFRLRKGGAATPALPNHSPDDGNGDRANLLRRLQLVESQRDEELKAMEDKHLRDWQQFEQSVTRTQEQLVQRIEELNHQVETLQRGEKLADRSAAPRRKLPDFFEADSSDDDSDEA